MLHIFPKEEYQREYNILISLLPKGVPEILKRLNVKVAGGTLTSLFSNRDINDIDLYFPSWKSIEIFCAYMLDKDLRKGEYDLTRDTNGWGNEKRSLFYFEGLDTGIPFSVGQNMPATPSLTIPELLKIAQEVSMKGLDLKTIFKLQEIEISVPYIRNIGMTDKSVMFSDQTSNPVMQCIAFDVFGSSQEIFDKFDFTINMGAFDFATENWEFDKNFMKHIAQKVLVVNPGTDYPIISMLRADKYRIRGYTISRRETMKLGLAASGLNIHTWDDAKAHLSGMYGTNVEELFNESRDFSFDLLFDKLDRAGDKIISTIATEKEKGEKSNYALTPTDYFPMLQRLRKSTGRKYFTKMFGVVPCANLYMMVKNKPRHTVGLLEDVIAKDFVRSVKLYIDEREARSHYKSQLEKRYGVWDDGAAFVEVSIDDTNKISYANAAVQILDEGTTKLKIEQIIESDGDFS